MKRLFAIILCASALAMPCVGSSNNVGVYGQTLQDQKSVQTYDVYVGKYQVAQDYTLTITFENGKLMGQPTGDEKAEFKPESGADQFYSSTVDAHLRFAKDKDGAVIAVVVTLDGKDYYSKKIN